MLVWRRALREGGLFVDVGANVGSYTIWAAELGAEVIALEPAADTFGLLAENIALNGYQVRAVQAAAGDHCGTARFTTGLDAGNSLAADGRVETKLVTVDSLIGDSRVAGLKVDVEGFELDVLRGATRALAERRIALIQLEWNETSRSALGTDRRPVAELLASYGYRLYRSDAKGCLRVRQPSFAWRDGQRVERRDRSRDTLSGTLIPVIQGVAMAGQDLRRGLGVLAGNLADDGRHPGKYRSTSGEHGKLRSLHVDLDHIRCRKPGRERVEGNRRNQPR